MYVDMFGHKHDQQCLNRPCDEPPVYHRLLLDWNGQQVLMNLVNVLPGETKTKEVSNGVNN